jgi:hypothetical protein
MPGNAFHALGVKDHEHQFGLESLPCLFFARFAGSLIKDQS